LAAALSFSHCIDYQRMEKKIMDNSPFSPVSDYMQRPELQFSEKEHWQTSSKSYDRIGGKSKFSKTF
jgi:hypothetical protein